MKSLERIYNTVGISSDSRLYLLIKSYLEEFPDDKEFVSICMAIFTTNYDELEAILEERKPGQRVRERDTDILDYCELILSPP